MDHFTALYPGRIYRLMPKHFYNAILSASVWIPVFRLGLRVTPKETIYIDDDHWEIVDSMVPGE